MWLWEARGDPWLAQIALGDCLKYHVVYGKFHLVDALRFSFSFEHQL
jgi:hypothetical protein